jgi:predicted ABC-type ATPase
MGKNISRTISASIVNILREIDLLVKQRAEFGFETTLAGKTYLNLVHRLKEQGYQVHCFFLWVSGVELALSRIRQRVLRGGHDVPEADVRRRFERSIGNFLVHYRPLAASWFLFDNSAGTPSVIAFEKHGELRIIEAGAYKALINHYA